MEPIIFFALVFAFILAMRYIQYRERLDMLRRGLTPKGYRPAGMSDNYRTGMLLPPEIANRKTGHLRPGMRSRLEPAAIKLQRDGINLSAVGLGLIVAFGLTLGWGVVVIPGIVILFVGLGLLLNYYMTTDGASHPQPPSQPQVQPAQSWQPPYQPGQPQGQPQQWSVPPAPAPYLGEQGKRER